MVLLNTGLTQEESTRLRKYADIIKGGGGRIDILTSDEQSDLQRLLKKTMLIQAVFREGELDGDEKKDHRQL